MNGLLLGIAVLLGTAGEPTARCTIPPAWVYQAYGLTRTLLLTDPGSEPVAAAGGLLPGLLPPEFGNFVMPLPGAPGYLVHASNFAGPDSATLAPALDASAGRIVLVPWRSPGCYRDPNFTATMEDWWPATEGPLVLFARLRPKYLWVRQVPTFDVFDGEEMPYGPTFTVRAGWPFRERGAPVSSEALFDFFRQIPARGSLPCAAPQGLQSLASWKQANPQAAKLRSLKELFKLARRSLEGDKGSKRKMAACRQAVG